MNQDFVALAFKDLMAELRSLREAVEPSVWEYRLVVLSLSREGGLNESQATLNYEGAEGWQALAVVPKIGKTPSLDCLAVMKRPKRSGTQI